MKNSEKLDRFLKMKILSIRINKKSLYFKASIKSYESFITFLSWAKNLRFYLRENYKATREMF